MGDLPKAQSLANPTKSGTREGKVKSYKSLDQIYQYCFVYLILWILKSRQGNIECSFNAGLGAWGLTLPLTLSDDNPLSAERYSVHFMHIINEAKEV